MDQYKIYFYKMKDLNDTSNTVTKEIASYNNLEDGIEHFRKILIENEVPENDIDYIFMDVYEEYRKGIFSGVRVDFDNTKNDGPGAYSLEFQRLS